MTRIFTAAAAFSLLIAGPAFAGDKPKRTFERDGITYAYTTTQVDGATVLEGHAFPVGGKFRLVIRDGKVTGYAGSARVAFRVADLKRRLAQK